jgi:hypothetical protein
LACGRRTVTSWIRTAGLSTQFRPCYTTVVAAGKKAKDIFARLVCEVVKPYGKRAKKRYRTFEATWRPASGLIRVVLVEEPGGWVAFFCTDLNATIEQQIRTAG